LANSPEAARRGAEIAAQAWLTGALTVADAIEAYQQAQRDKGNRDGSVEASGIVLRRFFGPVLDRPIATITPARAAELYEQLRTVRSERTGATLAADTHRNYMLQARSMLGWCCERKWFKTNPLAGVKGVGRRRHGKAQPRIDEARRLRAVCQAEAAKGDDGAVVVLIALLMGLRASEIVTRAVRDLDDQGRVLWVDDNETLDFQPKTEAGRRPVKVPALLQPLLRDCSRGKLPGALLFPGKGGAPHWRDWVRRQVRRLCRKAGVPVVCAHALRGTVATAALRGGADPELVARMLGHEEVSTTLRSYAAPGSHQAQIADRGLANLGG
jgi:integrase